jgi:PPOX class probable F420-dependent enzyme
MQYRIWMLSNTEGLPQVLDSELIAFLTAVNEDGQPQTSTVWFQRNGEGIVVYNRPDARRLRSIETNARVAMMLRADRQGHAVISLEGTAAVENDLPRAKDLPGYEEKYADEIADLGWTPDSFSDEYSVGIRIAVTRIRASGISRLLE